MIEQNEYNNQYTVEQVCTKCGLAPYILRYWEIHFPELRGAGGRQKAFYTSNDLALVWRIKRLLYAEMLTIEQAKKKLKNEKLFPLSEPGFAPLSRPQVIQPRAAEESKVAVEAAPAEKPVPELPRGIAQPDEPQIKSQPTPEQIRAEQERRYQEALKRAQLERRKVLRRRQVEAAINELRELRAKLG